MVIRGRAPLRVSFGGGGTDVAPFCEEQGGVVLLLVEPALHTYYVQPRQGQDIHAALGRPEGQQLLQPDLCGDDLGGTGVFRARLALGLSLPLGSGEVVLVDELGEFQIQEQLVQSVVVRRLAQVALRVEIDGGVGVDGGQVIGCLLYTSLLRELEQQILTDIGMSHLTAAEAD